MLPNQWHDNLEHKGGRQLNASQWKVFFETIDSYGILSDQPNETQVTDLGDGAELIYYPEVRREKIDHDNSWVDGNPNMVSFLDAIWFAHRRNRSSPVKDELDLLNPEVSILLVGVNYPANPLLLIPDIRGSYMISTSRYEQQLTPVQGSSDLKKRIIPKELNRLVRDALILFHTPHKDLKQSDPDVWSHDDIRYYVELNLHEGKKYGKGFSVDRWRTDKELQEFGWAVEPIRHRIVNILIESLDTNGHIFFVVGKPQSIHPRFDSINTQVIHWQE